eukprot:CAMPEP_0119412364 /NCGR_PEP_ID=MMETSP1335-20130426/4839_1 /TAXON_ID=259385 /ORGANISM="Chrysoculter rhomboideus, Strain RCC1486" /LENGTH=144 /DNA_ID=CAMNT_0007437097 /DNA_START=75 /DNA_END=509 /DNA_ORIENTATION=+
MLTLLLGALALSARSPYRSRDQQAGRLDDIEHFAAVPGDAYHPVTKAPHMDEAELMHSGDGAAEFDASVQPEPVHGHAHLADPFAHHDIPRARHSPMVFVRGLLHQYVHAARLISPSVIVSGFGLGSGTGADILRNSMESPFEQ